MTARRGDKVGESKEEYTRVAEVKCHRVPERAAYFNWTIDLIARELPRKSSMQRLGRGGVVGPGGAGRAFVLVYDPLIS